MPTRKKTVTEKRWGVIGGNGRVESISNRGQSLEDFRDDNRTGDEGSLMHRSWFVRVTLTYEAPHAR